MAVRARASRARVGHLLQFGACAISLSFLAQYVQAQALTETQSPRLTQLARDVVKSQAAVSDAFWQEIANGHAPLIEPIPGSTGEMFVTFLWRGAAGQEYSNVGVYGETSNTGNAWETEERLKRLPNSDVWYLTHRMSNRARFSYQLSWPQSATATNEPGAEADGTFYDTVPDPLNPKFYVRPLPNKPAIQTSYVEGPKAPPAPYLAVRDGVARGRVETVTFESRILGNQRSITIYTPPGAVRGCKSCDFLLLFDQSAYTSIVPTPTILDNLQAEALIRPIVAVFVGNGPPPARSRELPPNPKFLAFLRKELLPWIRERYAFSRDPRRAVVGGLSLGGLAAAYVALKSPDLFGNLLSQSGSYWWWQGWQADDDNTTLLNRESGWLTHEYATAERRSLRVYMEVGVWEGTLMNLPNRAFRDVLRAKGYSVDYREFVGGHDYACWRASLSEGLESLIGRNSPSKIVRPLRTTRWNYGNGNAG